jgi:uncharacterized membrane protein YadS
MTDKETTPLLITVKHDNNAHGCQIKKQYNVVARSSSTIETVPVVPQPWISEEYTSMILGLLWFALVLTSTLSSSVEFPFINAWTSEINIPWSSLVILWMAIIFSVMATHKCLALPIVVWPYVGLLLLTLQTNIIGNHQLLKSIGLGSSVWNIFFGLIIRNSPLVWFHDACHKKILSLEFLIKVSVVLLAIDLVVIKSIGFPGLAVAWGETIVIVLLIFAIGKYMLSMDTQEALITTCCTTICGSSAATAICTAIKGDKEMTTSLITISSVFTIPAIPLIAIMAQQMKMVPTAAGAWIGGCVDSTGAVVASASIFPEYLQAAIVVKSMQNILICPITLVVSTIWCKTCNGKILWDKFPKFVLGFLIVALITTLVATIVSTADISRLTKNSFLLSEQFSGLAFILIGMDIDLTTLTKRFSTYKMVALLYCIGQSIDIFTTYLVSAWLLH